MNDSTTKALTTLYRPVGPGQWEAIQAAGCRCFPPRLATQKYFYPLLYESFARRIAHQWHVERSGVGYVLVFQVRKSYLESQPIYIIGGPEHKEYRIHADELDGLNRNIVGTIRLLAVCGGDSERVQAG